MSSAMQTIVGEPVRFVNTTPAFTTASLDASGERAAMVFQVEDSMTITRLGFRYRLRTNTPPTYRISLQGVDGSGDPDGTPLGGGSPAQATFTPPADTSWNNTWQWLPLTNSIAVTRGQVVALVIDYSAGTIDASNFSTFTISHAAGVSNTQGVPYTDTYDGATWTRVGTEPVYGYGPASVAYGVPLETASAISVNLGSTPDEYGVFFSIPASWFALYQVLGVRLMMQCAAGQTMLMTLYDGTTALQQVSFDTDVVTPAGSNKITTLYFDEPTLATLRGGATYRIGFAPQTATNQTFREYTADTISDAYALGGGQYFGETQRTDSGAWTDDNTGRRPLMGVILADIAGNNILVQRRRVIR